MAADALWVRRRGSPAGDGWNGKCAVDCQGHRERFAKTRTAARALRMAIIVIVVTYSAGFAGRIQPLSTAFADLADWLLFIIELLAVLLLLAGCTLRPYYALQLLRKIQLLSRISNTSAANEQRTRQVQLLLVVVFGTGAVGIGYVGATVVYIIGGGPSRDPSSFLTFQIVFRIEELVCCIALVYSMLAARPPEAARSGEARRKGLPATELRIQLPKARIENHPDSSILAERDDL